MYNIFLYYSNMMLGQVNAVGQYVSDLDPEPDDEKRKRGNSLEEELLIFKIDCFIKHTLDQQKLTHTPVFDLGQ